MSVVSLYRTVDPSALKCVIRCDAGDMLWYIRKYRSLPCIVFVSSVQILQEDSCTKEGMTCCYPLQHCYTLATEWYFRSCLLLHQMQISAVERQHCNLFRLTRMYLFLHVFHCFHQNLSLSLCLLKGRGSVKLQHHHLVIFELDQDCLPKRPTQHTHTHFNKTTSYFKQNKFRIYN